MKSLISVEVFPDVVKVVFIVQFSARENKACSDACQVSAKLLVASSVYLVTLLELYKNRVS